MKIMLIFLDYVFMEKEAVYRNYNREMSIIFVSLDNNTPFILLL